MAGKGLSNPGSFSCNKEYSKKRRGMKEKKERRGGLSLQESLPTWSMTIRRSKITEGGVWGGPKKTDKQRGGVSIFTGERTYGRMGKKKNRSGGGKKKGPFPFKSHEDTTKSTKPNFRASRWENRLGEGGHRKKGKGARCIWSRSRH